MNSSDNRRDELSQSGYLFTYGTLQPDHAPEEIADLVRDFESLGMGSVRGTLYHLGSYPGAVLDETSTRRIWGTVFRLPEDRDVLSRLDAYEEYDPESPHASMFVRRLYPVQTTDGRVLPCWIYEYNGSRGQAPIVESGNWA